MNVPLKRGGIILARTFHIQNSTKIFGFFKSVQRPLPDPDNYYDGQTYIVLNRQSSIFRFNRNKSLGVFSPESPIRNFCISLFIHPMFSRFMMLTVIVNCGFMTLSKPPAFVENVLEHVFMTIYTLECIVKVCYNIDFLLDFHRNSMIP